MLNRVSREELQMRSALVLAILGMIIGSVIAGVAGYWITHKDVVKKEEIGWSHLEMFDWEPIDSLPEETYAHITVGHKAQDIGIEQVHYKLYDAVMKSDRDGLKGAWTMIGDDYVVVVYVQLINLWRVYYITLED